ncbi:uncharacterized protein LOC124454651 [Xenia sp. Carnegie-2017]|uniref:uncharacterized protein LOC124454651 n=1 Tax=Xenia sp. Carnegie-2017 TaxID=2897299 RepID=UPI001F036BC3|nr:uncharacterized protein LOC124454651 [Xenia sp. Carnegie-2017]
MSGGSHMFSESSDYKCTPVVGTKEKKSSPINSSKENFEHLKNEGKIFTFSCVGTKEKKSSPINSSEESVKHMKNEGTISTFSSPKLFTNKTSGSFFLGGVKIKNPGPPLRVGLSRNHKCCWNEVRLYMS